MRILDLITKKRNGEILTAEEIQELVRAFTVGEIPDYQMAAWLMAVYFRGMNYNETAALTLAMAHSGRMVDLSRVPGIKVDKHSTGGVADTTTLVVAPLVAAAGVPVAKMSGRGLGFTGGTIDKLEAIPGFQATLTEEAFVDNIIRHQLAVTGQSAQVAPADGKMYALRDVTATVESIPLIASSIMSKKIAAGADKILLDVKVGAGAFMKTREDAIALAECMVRIGQLVGRETRALLTRMDEPLGRAVGNSLEVEEAVEVLQGKAAGTPLYEVCLMLGANMLLLAGKAMNIAEARHILERHLLDGTALAKFREFVAAQGGDPAFVEEPSQLPQAGCTVEALSNAAGYVRAMDAAQIGGAAVLLGAGRQFKGQTIDLAAGLVLHVRIGDRVEVGQPLATLYASDIGKANEAAAQLLPAVAISPEPPMPRPLILGIVDSFGFHEI